MARKKKLEFYDDIDVNSDIELDIGSEDELTEIDLKILNAKRELKSLENKVKLKKKEEKYYGGFLNFINSNLNTGYHTMILAFFMFIGYFIAGLKYEGVRVWKSQTTVIFYIAFTVGFLYLCIFEYMKYRRSKSE